MTNLCTRNISVQNVIKETYGHDIGVKPNKKAVTAQLVFRKYFSLLKKYLKKEYNFKKIGTKMKKYFVVEKVHVYIKFLITLMLFIYVKDLSTINSFSRLTVALLEFIIILELVRMLIEFLFSDENRLKIRLMIDSTIVFFIRDIVLIVNDKFDFNKIFSILGIIAVLFIFRYVSMRYSPSHIESDYKQKLEDNKD